jgi:hypothetical protein
VQYTCSVSNKAPGASSNNANSINMLVLFDALLLVVWTITPRTLAQTASHEMNVGG